jgi:hypothetical protein
MELNKNDVNRCPICGTPDSEGCDCMGACFDEGDKTLFESIAALPLPELERLETFIMAQIFELKGVNAL